MKDSGKDQAILFEEGRKMRRGLKKIGLTLVAVGLSITLLLTGAMPVCEAGPDEKVVKIGWIAVYTGPLAATGAPAGDAIMEYARYLNEQGGINGYKLEIVWHETAARIPGAIIAHKRFCEAGVLIEINLLSNVADALLPRLARNEMPHILATAGNDRLMTMKPVPWVFAAEPCAGDSTAALMKWFKDTHWAKESPPKVGCLLFDVVSAWESLGGLKWVCEREGMEFVGYEVVPFMGAIDTSTEWLRLAGKADIIVCNTCGATQVVAIKDAYRLEILKKGVRILEYGYCITDNLDIVGAEADGWYYPLFAPISWEQAEEASGLKWSYEAAQRVRGLKRGSVLDSSFIVGGYFMAIACEAIRLAIEKVGYENLSGRAVRDAMVSIKDLDNGFVPSITVTDSKPWFSPGVLIYEVQQGKPHVVSGWIDYPGYHETLGY